MTTGGRAAARVPGEVELGSVGGWALGPTLTLMGSNIPEFQARGSYSIEEGCQLARGTQGWMGGDAGTLVSIAPGAFLCTQSSLCGHFCTADHGTDTPRARHMPTVLISMALSSMNKLTRGRENSVGLKE